MSSEEFWQLTHDEFDARVEAYQRVEKRWDLRFGVIASTYINTKLKQGTTPIKPGSFFGHADAEDEGPDFEMTPEQTVAHMKALMTVPK